jgi:hypothetical protein
MSATAAAAEGYTFEEDARRADTRPLFLAREMAERFRKVRFIFDQYEA